MRKLRGCVGLLLALVMAIALVGDTNAATLSSRFQVNLTASLTNPLDLVTSEAEIQYQKILEFANGTGASQANVIWTDNRTLTTAATEDLDFIGGGLTDALGVAVAPAKVRAVLIYSSPSNTTNLTLFGDANSILILNTAATTFTLHPGGVFMATFPATAGVAVTGGTGDIIQVVNGAGATATYDILVVGTSS